MSLPGPGGPGARQGFPRVRRIRRKRDFDLAYREGTRASGRFLVVVVRSNRSNVSRLGLSIGRNIDGAVERNRWKRRLREALRRDLSLRGQGLDIVVGVRSGAEVPTWSELVQELKQVTASAARRRARPRA